MMSAEEQKLEHLKLIEAVIERMAANSLRMKEWFVTIASAIVGFSVNSANANLALVAIGPLLVFWILDAFYLLQERKYRELYKLALQGRLVLYSLNVRIEEINKSFWGAILKSWSTTAFYGAILSLGVFLFYFREPLFKNLRAESSQIQAVSIGHIEVDKMTRTIQYMPADDTTNQKNKGDE